MFQSTNYERFTRLSKMQKFAVVSGLASIVGLGISLFAWVFPIPGQSGDAINYGDGGQAIGNNTGEIHNEYRINKSYKIDHNYPAAKRSGPCEESLPPGFSCDDAGYVLNKDGDRVCREIKWDGRLPMQIIPVPTECKLWDGSWNAINDTGW
jgi:hypothetical protein